MALELFTSEGEPKSLDQLKARVPRALSMIIVFLLNADFRISLSI